MPGTKWARNGLARNGLLIGAVCVRWMQYNLSVRHVRIVREQILVGTRVNDASGVKRNNDVGSNETEPTDTDAASLQRALCEEKGYSYVPNNLESKLGFAVRTQGKVPINGLRHPPTGGTNGWYIWCGRELSQDPDFFAPLHTQHLADRCPEAILFLGLPPGCRFLVAGD